MENVLILIVMGLIMTPFLYLFDAIGGKMRDKFEDND